MLKPLWFPGYGERMTKETNDSSAPQITRTRPDYRGRQRRRKIFQSLHDCVLAQGYLRTSLADIAKHAGMSPSHLLYYFNGKDDILEQYFQLVAERFVERLAGFETQPHRQQIQSLADFWFRGETSTREEIGFMLECFGAAVHDSALRATKGDFDRHCKAHLGRIFQAAPTPLALSTRDAAELSYSMMIGLRSAVYFDDSIDLDDAHRLFRENLLQMCGYR